MKLFNLQSKTGLVGWSAVLSLVINYALHFYSRNGSPILATVIYPDEKIAGWPLSYMVYGGWPPYQYVSNADFISLFVNFVFWTLAVFIVLSLIRYIKNKNSNH